MTAQPGNVAPRTEGTDVLAERLSRSLEAAIKHGSALARQLADEGEVWHAGLLAGAVASLNGVNHAVEIVTRQYSGQ